MKDLEQLREKILNEIKEEYTQKLAVATKTEEERISQANARFAELEMVQKTAAKQEAKALQERNQQAVLNASKKELLRVKRELLDSIFQETEQILKGWSNETLAQFIRGVLTKLNVQEQAVICFGEETVEAISQEQKQEITHQFPMVSFDTETISKKAGFTIRCGGIEYNYLFDELMTDMKSSFSPQLAKMAFEG